MISLLYLTHGRLEFTWATLPTLIGNTDLSLVSEFIVYNDATPERDGSTSFFVRALIEGGAPIQLRETNLRSPVSVMSHFLARTQCKMFAKIDNDIVVPPGWLSTMVDVMERHPEVALLGAEPGQGGRPPEHWPEHGDRYGVVKASHIGGVGLMRRAAFDKYPAPLADGRFGFTEWQHTYNPGSFWIAPDLKLFSLDMIPVEPWLGYRERFIKEHINRVWPLLDPRDCHYWDWWTE